jgi:hypothetical protein
MKSSPYSEVLYRMLQVKPKARISAKDASDLFQKRMPQLLRDIGPDFRFVPYLIKPAPSKWVTEVRETMK